MNFSVLINAFVSMVLALGLTVVGSYQAYKFVRSEVIAQSQKGLPSLEKFSRQLTNHKIK